MDMLLQERGLRYMFMVVFTAVHAEALVFCITNDVDYHQQAPTGLLAQSGWQQTVPIDTFLGTIVHSNAVLTAAHVWEIDTNDTFFLEGTHQLTSKVTTPGSDLAIFFFSPPVTNPAHIARINIECDLDTNTWVIYQGRGTERGALVSTGILTNGWMWSATNWWQCTWGIRRWGRNQTFGATSDGLCAIASFDNTGDPDECMLSIGDSGGPGFIQTGSGWKVAMVNYSVFPSTFTYSTNSVSEFNATLYDCAGLYYQNENNMWEWVPPENSPAPCLLYASRTATQIAWITNVISGLSFPADVMLMWCCPTNRLTREQALLGYALDLIVSNAGPYTARDLVINLTWPPELHIKTGAVTQGIFTTNQWALPVLRDGGVATLRVDTVTWSAFSHWVTNQALITHSDKPDENSADNEAQLPIFLPQTTATLMIIL